MEASRPQSGQQQQGPASDLGRWHELKLDAHKRLHGKQCKQHLQKCEKAGEVWPSRGGSN